MIDLKKSYGGRLQKVIAVISLLCLLLSFGAIPASAAGTAKVTVSSCTVERGTLATVTLSIEGNPGIWGLKLKIGYDKSNLTLKSAAAGSVFNNGELVMSEKLDTEPYVIVATSDAQTNKTADGKFVTLTFTVAENAEFKAYPVSIEVVQAINSNGKELNIQTKNGAVTVVKCVHTDQEWRVTTAAQCETAGKESMTCKKCGETFETREIAATGHLHAEIRNSRSATAIAEGYTGDTYCKDCGKLLSKGNVIPMLNTETTSPEIIKGKDAKFIKGTSGSLEFVSNADFDKFIRVEIDSKVLDEKDYTVKSGSTVITVSADYLNKLDSGSHTLSIVSENGTAETQFTIEEKAVTSAPETKTNGSEPQTNKIPVWLVVIAIILIVLAGGATVFIIMKKRRG